MASVPLRFIPPDDPDYTTLFIYEGPTVDGPFAEIEVVTDVGTYPNYITEYTTDQAASATGWFAIAWQDSKGASTGVSAAIQGGTENLVAMLSARVQLLDPSMNEAIVIQQTEDVVGEYFNATDPLSVLPADASFRVRAGLTLLIMARYRLLTLANSTTSWTAGLVSMKSSDSTQTITALKEMMKQADRLLGLGYSRIAQMVLPEIAGGLSEIVSADISRLLIEVD